MFGIAAGSECGGVLSDVWFVNNLVYKNNGPGLIVADWGGPYAHPARDIHFINNTVAFNGRPNGWGGGMVFENTEASEIDVRNNILANNGTGQFVVVDNKRPASWTLRHNLVWGIGEHLGERNIVADPMFVDPEDGNFHLRHGSPAIGAASEHPPCLKDLDGNSATSNKPSSLGAYAYEK